MSDEDETPRGAVKGMPLHIGLYKKERPPVKQNKKSWLKICVFHTFCAISVQSDMLENRQNLRDCSCLFSITEHAGENWDLSAHRISSKV